MPIILLFRWLIFRIMMPVARAPLMVGVNQVIMLSLNMVIIASMIKDRALRMRCAKQSSFEVKCS